MRLHKMYLLFFAASNAVNMASALGRLARLSALRNGRTSPLTPVFGPGRTVTPGRTAVSTSSGAILPKPKKVSAALKARCGVCVNYSCYELRHRREVEELPWRNRRIMNRNNDNRSTL